MTTDVEVYIRTHDPDPILKWVRSTIGKELLVDDAGDSQIFHCRHKDVVIPVVLTKVDDEFTSIWFNSDQTPWRGHLDCARDAYQNTRIEVRCDDGSMNPNTWISISAEGEAEVQWLPSKG